MSFRKGDIAVICAEPDGTCELCGKIAELRPYGPRGERICWECGNKDPQITELQMNRVLFGVDTQ